MAVAWGYQADNGPAQWSSLGYPATGGARQSPVNLDSRLAMVDKSLQAVVVGYNDNNCLTMENTAMGWRMAGDSEGSSLTGQTSL